MYEWLVEVSLQQFQTYGLVVLAVVCVLEGMVVGKLLPVRLIVAVAVIAHSSTIQDIAVVFVLVVVASTSGQYALFLLTRYNGREAIQNARVIRVSDNMLDRGEQYFDRWGVQAIVGANSLPYMRGLLTAPSAVSNVNVGKFLAASIVGNAVYYSAFIALVSLIGLHMF